MIYGGMEPGEVQHGAVPILQHSQAHRDTRNFEKSYNNEEREYCVVTT